MLYIKRLFFSLLVLHPFSLTYSQISSNSTDDEVFEYACAINANIAALSLEARQEGETLTEAYKGLMNKISSLEESEVKSMYEDQILRTVNHAYTMKIDLNENKKAAVEKYKTYWFQDCMSEYRKIKAEKHK